MVAPRKAALLEESAEVEVLFANMEKMKALTKKIQGSVNRLDASGKAVQEAISPIYGNTQKLQIVNTNIDRVIEAIERLKAPREESEREERIIRAGPGRGDLDSYIASLDRSARTLADLKRTNLRSNEKAVAQLNGLLKVGNKQLEDVFRGILQDSSREKVQPLEYVAKRMSFLARSLRYANSSQIGYSGRFWAQHRVMFTTRPFPSQIRLGRSRYNCGDTLFQHRQTKIIRLTLYVS
jgi:exocyst complex component 7